ncbi:hypothetical protein AMJ49_03340 [Parcubacteria bacterium DG_74_2]|nr:MAG: hypothetical protein AMJ49_03340 [Parcubacteria bacterium DG_74_2]
MVKEISILILIFYFLAILQSSFLPHFLKSDSFLNPVVRFFYHGVNLPLLAMVLISFFLALEKKLIFFSAFLAGFFLDLFSTKFFGFWTLISFSLLFLTEIIKKHVRIPFIKKP